MKLLIIFCLVALAICVSAGPKKKNSREGSGSGSGEKKNSREGSGSGEKKNSHEGSGSGEQKCPANEEWKDCGNPCDDRCPDGRELMCIYVCEAACFCKEGFKRIDGVCQEITECAEQGDCKCQNERYRYSDACAENCNTELRCLIGSTWGCFCMKGYKRDSFNGRCIPEKQCSSTNPTECKDNQIYKLSSECDNICDGKCGIACCDEPRYGFYCIDGYKYDSNAENCVKIEECFQKGD